MKSNRKLIEESILFAVDNLFHKIQNTESAESCMVYAKAIKDCGEAFALVHYRKMK